MWGASLILPWLAYLSSLSSTPGVELEEAKEPSATAWKPGGEEPCCMGAIKGCLKLHILVHSCQEEDQRQAVAYVLSAKAQMKCIRVYRTCLIGKASTLPAALAAIIEAYTPSWLNLEDGAQKTPLDYLPRSSQLYSSLRAAGGRHSELELGKAFSCMALSEEQVSDQTPYRLAVQGQKVKIWLVLQHPCLKRVALPGQEPCTDLRDPWSCAGRLYLAHYKAPRLPCGLSHDVLGLI